MTNPISLPIWNSLQAVPHYWLAFYGQSALLVIATSISAGLLLFRSNLALGLAAIWLTFLAMVYFRLLGRLAWICQEATTTET